jgi:hypothetical protein
MDMRLRLPGGPKAALRQDSAAGLCRMRGRAAQTRRALAFPGGHVKWRLLDIIAARAMEARTKGSIA